MPHTEQFDIVKVSNRLHSLSKTCLFTLALLQTSACRMVPQASQIQSGSSASAKPKADLFSTFGDLTLCPEANAEALGLVALPKDSSDPNRCNSLTSSLMGLGVFRHDRGCSSPQKILAATQLASLLTNDHLFGHATVVSLSRRAAAAITARAAQAAPRTTAPKWVLLTTYLRSQSNSRALQEPPNTISAATSEGTADADPEMIEGVFVHAQENAEAFGEIKKSDLNSRAAPRSQDWAAFDTPTWENLTNRDIRKNDSPQHNITAAVQQAELMGDLADIVIIGAIRGGINNDARIETIKFEYIRGSEGITSKPLTTYGPKTGSILQRLQVRDAACQQSDPKEFMLRLRELHHVRYSTYQRITALNEGAVNGTTGHPGPSAPLDLTPEMQRNMQEVATILYRKCISNRLHFDLETNDQIPASAEKPVTRFQCNLVPASR